MLWVPEARLATVQVAVRVFPLPDNDRAEHPLIEVPPSTKLTVPVGATPVTLAVKVMLAPSAAGFEELASVVLVLATPTACYSDALAAAPLLEFPP